MNEEKFKIIDDLNDSLKNTNELVLKTFSNIESVTQEKVDDLCERVSKEINEKLNKKRTILINSLKQGYSASNEIIATLEPIVTLNPTDLNGVINAINKIIAIYQKPYQTAVEFVTILTPKLLTLSKNISDLSEIPNKIPKIENINFDKLNIVIEPITINDIIN